MIEFIDKDFIDELLAHYKSSVYSGILLVIANILAIISNFLWSLLLYENCKT